MIEFWRGKNLLVSFFIKVLHREYNPLILLRITPQRNAALFSFLSFLKDFISHFVSSALIVITVQAFQKFRKVDTESAKFTLSSSNSCSGEIFMNIWHSSFGTEKTSWLSDPVSVVCHKLQLKIYTLYPVLQRLMDFFFIILHNFLV